MRNCGNRGADKQLVIRRGTSDLERCIALDQRGHGDSVRPGEYRFHLLESDFREFVDTLSLQRFSLVAHSMGGVVGLLFAENTPERLQSLVLEDTSAPMDRHEYPTIPAQPPEPVDYDWSVRRQLFAELNSPDPAWWTALPELTTPTLLIAGTRDDRDIKETAEQLPDVRIVTIDVGHWIHETAPDRFLEAVNGFFHS